MEQKDGAAGGSVARHEDRTDLIYCDHPGCLHSATKAAMTKHAQTHLAKADRTDLIDCDHPGCTHRATKGAMKEHAQTHLDKEDRTNLFPCTHPGCSHRDTKGNMGRHMVGYLSAAAQEARKMNGPAGAHPLPRPAEEEMPW